MSQVDELVAEAEIGEAARAFLESELGQVMIGIAHQELEAAREALEIVGPTETEKIRQLQNKALNARQFEQWLVELVTKGNNALEVYKHQEG